MKEYNLFRPIISYIYIYIIENRIITIYNNEKYIYI